MQGWQNLKTNSTKCCEEEKQLDLCDTAGESMVE